MKDFLKNILGQHDMKEEDIDPEGTVIQGKILSLNDKGFGFISSTSLRFTKIYFHWSALEQDTLNFALLKKGMKVEFKLIHTQQGPRGIKVRVLEGNRDDRGTTEGDK